ncbi:MAG: hypothetical protein NT013_20430 [Planctomycetia bacterium]|nr:hypothetical protein [Planctomycetia bacterium]
MNAKLVPHQWEPLSAHYVRLRAIGIYCEVFFVSAQSSLFMTSAMCFVLKFGGARLLVNGVNVFADH